LEGRDFPIYKDHKALTFMFKQRSDKASPRQIRHISFIGQFTTDIRYISGQGNIVADASISMQPTCTMEDIAAAQKGEPKDVTGTNPMDYNAVQGLVIKSTTFTLFTCRVIYLARCMLNQHRDSKCGETEKEIRLAEIQRDIRQEELLEQQEIRLAEIQRDIRQA
jgi:hypothetical protein